MNNEILTRCLKCEQITKNLQMFLVKETVSEIYIKHQLLAAVEDVCISRFTLEKTTQWDLWIKLAMEF